MCVCVYVCVYVCVCVCVCMCVYSCVKAGAGLNEVIDGKNRRFSLLGGFQTKNLEEEDPP